MERLTPEVYCRRAALELIALLRHQRKPRGRVRHESSLLRRYVKEVSASYPSVERRDGPWAVGRRPLKRPGRGGLAYIPVAQLGSTTIMLSTPQEAEELVAFLNQCGISELGVS